MRIKRMGVSMELLRSILQQGNRIPPTTVTSGLPPDAVVCGIQLFDGVVWLDIESATFEEVEEGKEFPNLDVTFERTQ